MPLEPCTKNGLKGYRWGNGACYTGPGAKKKAMKQGYAESPDDFQQEMDQASAADRAEAEELLTQLEDYGPEALEEDFSDRFLDSVSAYISQKERDKMPESDFAWPEARKFPVKDQAHLDSAVRL